MRSKCAEYALCSCGALVSCLALRAQSACCPYWAVRVLRALRTPYAEYVMGMRVRCDYPVRCDAMRCVCCVCCVVSLRASSASRASRLYLCCVQSVHVVRTCALRTAPCVYGARKMRMVRNERVWCAFGVRSVRSVRIELCVRCDCVTPYVRHVLWDASTVGGGGVVCE